MWRRGGYFTSSASCTCGTTPPDVLMESRMRGNSHVRFGGRRRGDHRLKAGTGVSPPTLRVRRRGAGARFARQGGAPLHTSSPLAGATRPWLATRCPTARSAGFIDVAHDCPLGSDDLDSRKLGLRAAGAGVVDRRVATAVAQAGRSTSTCPLCERGLGLPAAALERRGRRVCRRVRLAPPLRSTLFGGVTRQAIIESRRTGTGPSFAQEGESRAPNGVQ
jgi:hypothetical protein